MRRTGDECRRAVEHARDRVAAETGSPAELVFADVNDEIEAAREAARLVRAPAVDVLAGAVVAPPPSRRARSPRMPACPTSRGSAR